MAYQRKIKGTNMIKKITISLAAILVPLLFTINIVRTITTNNKNNTIGFGTMLERISNIEFSFPDTIERIAEAGKAWKETGDQFDKINDYTDEGFFKNLANAIKNLFTGIWKAFQALWESIKVPIIAIGEILYHLYECLKTFISFTGIIPGH